MRLRPALRPTLRLPAAALGAFVLACAPVVAGAADRLVAGGTTLAGKVKAVTGTGVEFAPDFAKDTLLVPWENVEDLSTEAAFQVLYGEDGEATAPLGMRDGKLVVGDAAVDPKTLVSVEAAGDDGRDFGDSMRSTFRHWHGGLNLAFNVQQATTDTLGLLVGASALRSSGPTRLMLGADYRYSTQRDPDAAPPKKKRIGDAVSGAVRGEYDFTKRFFGYGSTDALYDAIQNLSLRAVPKVGVGYVLWQREPKEDVRDFLQVEVGGGWVYEKYLDNGTPPDPVIDEDDYFTIAFGASAAVLLPRGASLDWRLDWLPAVDDFTGDYVVRTAAGLNVPLIDPVSARLAIVDTYDSTPASGANKNSLHLDTGLSLNW